MRGSCCCLSDAYGSITTSVTDGNLLCLPPDGEARLFFHIHYETT